MHQAVRRSSVRHGFVISPRVRGMGTTTAPSATQITQQIGSIASSTTVSVLSATALTGGFTGIFGLTAAQSIPIIGAAIAGVMIGITTILNSGCGQTCIETSQWANQAAALLEQNIQAYFGNPAPRTAEQQAQALANFDAIWQKLVQLCSAAGLGSAGQRCISDRQAGACTWKQTGNPEFPGQPTTGQCWNWFNSYRDPIAADPAIVTSVTVNGPGAAAGSGTGSSGLPTSIDGIDLSTIALVGGAGLLILAIAGGN